MRGLVLLCLLASLAAARDSVSLDEYRARRNALRDDLEGAVTILMGSTESERGSLHSPFFQEANFYYLTGWNEPGAILVVAPDDEVFFVPKRDPEREKWTGRKATPNDDDITIRTGFERVQAAETFESWINEIVETAPRVYTLLKQPYAEKLQALLPLRELKDAAGAIAKLRMTKSPAELALVQRSTDVTIEAHRAAWNRIAPGLFEYQLAATMSNVYFDAGCARHAYPPIVGSGPNATILHYNANTRRFDAGELVLMDVGAECHRYAADLTRTVPVSGRFTRRQREIYGIVLGAQQAAIAAVKPGMTLAKTGPNSLYRVACDYIDSHGEDRHGKSLGRYFTHGIGHHVGLDVHDPINP
ncbi:MAG: aminopeptidase P family protein, partial [bacterium]|nr:aminopeptidase P family protein [bacterium]